MAHGHLEGTGAAVHEEFGAARFEPGPMWAIDAVEALLVQHFAAAPGQRDDDELPDRPETP